jgi:monomeric isocitrate dehydrogenase
MTLLASVRRTDWQVGVPIASAPTALETRPGAQQPEPASRSPARKVGGLGNHGSHFYLALYWAQGQAAQGKSAALQVRFEKLPETLAVNEAEIMPH